MDTVGMVMWCEVALGPYVRDYIPDGRLGLVMDNFSAHHTVSVIKAFEAANVTLKFLVSGQSDNQQVCLGGGGGGGGGW